MIQVYLITMIMCLPGDPSNCFDMEKEVVGFDACIKEMNWLAQNKREKRPVTIMEWQCRLKDKDLL